MVERDVEAAHNVFLLAFAGAADIDGQGWLRRRQKFGGKLGAEAFRYGYQIRPSFETTQTVLQVSGYVIESDAAQANRGLVFSGGGPR